MECEELIGLLIFASLLEMMGIFQSPFTQAVCTVFGTLKKTMTMLA